MKKYSDLEYLKLSKWQRFLHKIASFFASIPRSLKNAGLAIVNFFKNIFLAIGREISDICTTFVKGDWKTKISYVIMGFGNCARGQILRGLLFFLFELVFIFYMFIAGIIFPGGHGGAYWLSMLPSLGLIGPHEEYNMVLDSYTTVYGDNSFKILLYGVLTIFFIIAFIYTWRQNIKQNKIAEQILRSGKPLKSGKQDLHSLVDDQFHKTLLALPMTGIIVFTVLPIVFMILVAFTNYDGTHDGYNNSLFTWQGLENFRTMLSWSGSGNQVYSATFGEILTWTLIWAFFATFTNYFLGMFVAMMINKKGIRIKKVWRTILVLTIAIPQFISLLYVSKMFAKNGIINGMLLDWKWITSPIPFWEDPTLARIMVIVINIWIGIPYLMLIATGILMNIPQDLYESSRIDGAGPWKQYTKITLPYMLFITGPYLLTSFTSNMNNFNVIYLLTGGAPTNVAASSAAGSVGFTDLLITWLFKITTGEGAQYYMASVVGILVFIVVAVISLVVYGLLPSIKNEEDFQ
ncbi:MAG: sugar ABC transporter permease [Lachnospiraceae bacterium]|nr:sugar ABC transporter permease [Lachnospiraceae bacterium]